MNREWPRTIGDHVLMLRKGVIGGRFCSVRKRRKAMFIGKEILADVLAKVVNEGAAKATYFIDKKFRIRVVRKVYRVKRKMEADLVVTIGKPNFAERAMIKKGGFIFPRMMVKLE